MLSKKFTLYYSILIFGFFILPQFGHCYDPSPAFPLPEYDASSPELRHAYFETRAWLARFISSGDFNDTSYSIEVTSSKETLWSLYHTAQDQDEDRPGTEKVDGSSAYRIASITKVFTVLGLLQQHAAATLNLDNKIDHYIPELKKKQQGSIPWKDITLRALASQLSGIPNDFAQSDLINNLPDPTLFGFPPVSHKGLPKCDEYSEDYHVPCGREDLLKSLQGFAPIFPPNMKSTYCNTAYELLGLAIENVTGMAYEEYITSYILDPLGMNHTSFEKPPDDVGVIPKGRNYWDIEEKVQNPTGGIYSSSSDLSTFLRYILTHYNGLTPTVNWFQPASYGGGLRSFYGMPWEIYRTSSILHHTNRPVTFVTKGGGLPAYSSLIIAMPEYDLGVTILVGGNATLLRKALFAVTVPLTHAAEIVGQRTLKRMYTGTYSTNSQAINSSITLAHSPVNGLYIDQFISNGTEVFELIGQLYGGNFAFVGKGWRAQLIPTLLFRDELNQEGEIWRMEVVPDEERAEGKEKTGEGKSLTAESEVPWGDFQLTHVDNVRYGGVPLNEVVFWKSAASERRGGGGDDAPRYDEIELSAFRIRLSLLPGSSRMVADEEDESWIDQMQQLMKQI